MTPEAINNKLKKTYEDNRLYYFSTTCLKSVYITHITDMTFNDEEAVVTWTDANNGVIYHMDYEDINMVVEKTKDGNIPPLLTY